MCFQDILHCSQESKVQIETEEAPAFFSDLNLDQIVHAVTMGKESYNLKPYFHTPLGDIQTIQYRQEIAQDFENEALMDVLKAFANEMIIVRRYLGLVDKLSYRYHRESWFLEAALVYSNAVTSLLKGMSEVDIKSNGLQAFRTYLTEYAGTTGFVSLMNEATHIKHELSKVQYNVLIKGLRVTVSRPAETESDYSREVEDTFRHLQQVTTVKHKPLLVTGSGMSPVEAQILEFVARLYPDVFAALLSYYARNHDFVDETISTFDRQAQFYIAYLDYIARYKRMGLPFCYPSMSAEDKEVYADEAFDLALARKLSPEHVPVVCNDFHLQNKERIMVVSGPNQGGKTTWPAWGCRYLANVPSSFSSTIFSPILSRKRISKTCAVNCRTT